MPETLRESIRVSPNIEWESKYGELGVEAKFFSFWDKVTAYNFGMDPAIFIDVFPVNSEIEKDENFYKKLAGRIAQEIIEKVLGDEKKLEETILDEHGYDAEKQILSLVLFERDNDWTIPYPGKNELPL